MTLGGEKFLPLARRVVEILELDGTANMQVFLCADHLLPSQVTPRIGGGLPLSERAGGGLLHAVLDHNPTPLLEPSSRGQASGC